MNQVPVFRPTIRREGMDSVLGCLVADQIGPGGRTQELSAAVADALGMAGGIALADYGLALSCALATVKVKVGARVLCSALAPQAHLHAVERNGLKPLVLDVDVESGMLDLTLAEQARGTAAVIMIDHTLGFIPDVALLRSWELPVIEDITCSLGGYDGETASEPRGDLSVVSLGYAGLLTAAGGALLLCRTKALLASARQIAFNFADPLANLNAALTIAQLKRYGSDMETRRTIREVYHAAITRTRHRTLIPPAKGNGGDQVPFSYPVVVADGVREVEQYAAKTRIETRPAYADSIVAIARRDGEEITYGAPDGDVEEGRDGGFNYPAADSLLRRCLLFPLYPLLGESRIEIISKVLATLP